jgi:hypothetical protein|tara:strand:- start:163 stop:312 length:150 start_codon:yes stop_codon:yes gene_type:complete
LHDSVGKGHKKIAKLLIVKGADIHVKHYGGATPFWITLFGMPKQEDITP